MLPGHLHPISSAYTCLIFTQSKTPKTRMILMMHLFDTASLAHKILNKQHFFQKIHNNDNNESFDSVTTFNHRVGFLDSAAICSLTGLKLFLTMFEYKSSAGNSSDQLIFEKKKSSERRALFFLSFF